MLRRCFSVIHLLLASLLSAPTFAQESYRVYLGTYTDSASQGIYHCQLDLADGTLSPVALAAKTSSPSFLAIHPNKKYMYAVNESEATISAFAIDSHTGNLTFLNRQPSQGDAPCHLVVDSTGKYVLAANYTGGSCICLPIAIGDTQQAMPVSSPQCRRISPSDSY